MGGCSIRILKFGWFPLIGASGKATSLAATLPLSRLRESYCDLPSHDMLLQVMRVFHGWPPINLSGVARKYAI